MLTTAGNVAIGGTTADEKLHVHGNAKATGDVAAQSVTINGKPISYNASKNTFVLAGNLLVEGGFAWNSRFEDFTEDEIFSITKAVSIDGTSIIRDGGVLRVNPDYIQSVGGLNENELHNYLTNNKYITESALQPYATTDAVNSLLTEYLPKSGGTLSGDISTNSFSTGTDNLGVFLEGKSKNGIRLQYYKNEVSYDMLLLSDGEMQWNKQHVIHSGNVANYALPITGGTVNGNITAPKFIGALEGNADRAYRLIKEDGSNLVHYGANTLYVGGGIYGNSQTHILGNSISFRYGASAEVGLMLTTAGNVVIGGTTASEKLHVHGNILATGRIAWNSSRVLKTEIKEHYLSLDELEQIKPYSYKWKDDRDNLVHVGAIADEVMEILPETVLTDTLGIHSMDYAQTAFVMAASLTPHVSDHERRIKELETENVALKEEIEKLKRAA
jgi:cytoskeletal protein CcmA (bactofilin family)